MDIEGIAASNAAIRKALTIEATFWNDEDEHRRYEIVEEYRLDELFEVAGAEARGQVIGCRDAICKFLQARFRDVAQGLQYAVRRIDDLEILSQIIKNMYTACSLEEIETVVVGVAHESR